MTEFQDVPLVDATFLVLDTETTGLQAPEHSPVEVGFVLTTITKVLASGSSLVNPGRPILSEAKACHHLEEDDVKDAPDLSTALKTIVAPAIQGFPLHAYVAHNAEFDSSMLPMLHKLPWFCTLLMAQKLYPDLPHHSNQYLRYELKLDVPEAKGLPAHRALADAFVTAALLRHMLARLPEGWPTCLLGTLERLKEPNLISICPYKKHQGKPFAQVAQQDRQYLVWLLSPKPDQKPLSQDMAYSIRYWLSQVSR